jgi:RNA polymerase sigma factor (sigma-70 family)
VESIKNMSGTATDDAELAREARDGDRDAYGRIVARYQSLICSLAYCRTGSVSRSEDIAQETFVTAWKGLRDLREPGSLRAWLCGIARNLINNSCRRLAREPAQIGETLDSLHEVASPESSPPDQAIRNEEEAILWRAMESIPENYREPLVLYYREQRSVARVAEYLGLSEDAAKQRLARGRGLLQERVLALVEGTLERTGPGPAFTSGVLSVLPMLGTSVAAAMAASTAKASTTAKAVTSASGLGLGATFLGLFAGLASYIGWKMSDTVEQSQEERRSVHRFWSWAVIGMAATILPIVPLMIVLRHWQPWLFAALTWWLGAVYVFVGVPLAIWAWEHHVRVRLRRQAEGRGKPLKRLGAASIGLLLIGFFAARETGFPSGYFTDLCVEVVFAMAGLLAVVCCWESLRSRRNRSEPEPEPNQPASRGVPRSWVALATAGMAAVLAFLLLDMVSAGQAKHITQQAALDLVAARHDAKVYVLEYQSGAQILELRVPGIGKPTGKAIRYFAPLDKPASQALIASGAAYKILRQGQDFEIFGWPGRMLFLLAAFVVVAGIVVLVKTRQQPRPSAAG